MDGYLKIKTKIDNSEVDKQIKALETKIKKLQDDNSKKSQEQDALQSEINRYEELNQKAEEYRQKIESLNKERQNMFFANNDNRLHDEQLPQYAQVVSELDKIRTKYLQATSEIDKQAPKINKVYAKLEQVKNKQTENNAKMSEFRQQIEQVNMNKIQSGIDNVGKGISNQVKKIGKLGLAVVGIRSAWYAVRGAISSVTQYNDQVSADFEYMRFAIAQMLLPAVQQLVKILYTVLSYVNAITSAWFGINLFSNASTKAFQKMNKSASGTAKATKEIQKSLQGFDEMNVLSDNSDSGSSTGVASPSFDLSSMQAEVPAWLKWIIDNKDLILSTLGGITAGIIALKLGLGGIKALGIGIMVKGIIDLISSLKGYLEDPTWENFGKVIKSIGEIILGLGILIGNVPLIIAGAIAVIVGLVVSNWEKIKGKLDEAIEWMTSKTDWVKENFGIVGEFIWKKIIEYISLLKNALDEVFKFAKNIFDGILQVFKGIFTGDMKTVLNGFKQIFKTIFDALWGIAKYPLNLIIKGINSLIRGANKIKFNVPDWVPGLGGMNFGFNIPQIPLLARGTVVSRPTPAIIGEAGKEAVVPLENNLEWLDILADKLSSKIGNNGGSYIIQMDSRTIQRGIAKRQQELAFATNGR